MNEQDPIADERFRKRYVASQISLFTAIWMLLAIVGYMTNASLLRVALPGTGAADWGTANMHAGALQLVLALLSGLYTGLRVADARGLKRTPSRVKQVLATLLLDVVGFFGAALGVVLCALLGALSADFLAQHSLFFFRLGPQLLTLCAIVLVCMLVACSAIASWLLAKAGR